MKSYIAVLILTILGTTLNVQAQTCTGENGNCHQPRPAGEYLNLGSRSNNFLYLKPGSNLSYAASFYRSLSINQETGRIGYESTLIKSIPNLLRCEMTVRSGNVSCTFAGPQLSERQNLLNDRPAKVNLKTARALAKFNGHLVIVNDGLEYFCSSQTECYVQVNATQFPGGFAGQL